MPRSGAEHLQGPVLPLSLLLWTHANPIADPVFLLPVEPSQTPILAYLHSLCQFPTPRNIPNLAGTRKYSLQGDSQPPYFHKIKKENKEQKTPVANKTTYQHLELLSFQILKLRHQCKSKIINTQDTVFPPWHSNPTTVVPENHNIAKA